MLWYLLYPLRGTTQPPSLSANHPIRRAFYRHGKTTAQHWLVAMLVSVAIAMGFSYPTIFLAENPTAGFAAYPHHVWTTAKPFDGNPALVDVEMRQIWVHGSYMKALQKDVLNSALEIQQTIVGNETLTSIIPALSEKLRSGTLSWGYHSPLMYWNNSQEVLNDDSDIVQTINDQSRSSSSLNVALRPASVFAGKKFDRRNLRAADALIITLMNKVESGADAGDRWTDKMRVLARGACENCTLFPHDGHITRHRNYEFKFMPLSAQESIAFAFAYSCMALYVLLSLRRLKAFHSRFGLVVTAITQMTCSVLASFTICGILKINLSMIPQNAYPFVVLVIGLENMFRLINAILAYQPTMATDLRIANALGDVGPVSTATAVQNVITLSLLARFVSPGVAAFCAFACIATLFDAFFLLTFFVAVLNVDIRRLELQDALARTGQAKPKRKPSPSQHTWFDALVHGTLPFSTRMAGTAVTTAFILSLNYHFFERHEKSSSLGHLLGLARRGPPSVADFDTFTPPPMNASLTPGQWMRMQDFDTTREVMRLAKPGADYFVIRVFAPLIVVLPDADRNEVLGGAEAWTHALHSFAIHHFYPVAVAIVFAVAFVAVLMNFLLYSDAAEDADTEDRFEDALTVSTVAPQHRLDIVKISGTQAGHFVSIGLDRSIVISVFDHSRQTYCADCISPKISEDLRWPVRHAELDESGEWLACHTADDEIMIYNRQTGSIIRHALRYPDDNPPVVFRFVRVSCEGINQTQLIILTSGGRLAMRSVDADQPCYVSLSNIPLLGATVVEPSNQKQKLFLITEDARLVSFIWAGDRWIEAASALLTLETTHGKLTGYTSISTYPELSEDILIVAASTGVLLVDMQSLESILRIPAGDDADSPMKVIIGAVTSCTACGGLALRSLGLAAACATSDKCVLTSWCADNEAELPICLRSASKSCHRLSDAKRSTHQLVDAGAWHGNSQAVLGLRKRKTQGNGHKSHSIGPLRPMRHRRPSRQHGKSAQDTTVWEAYKFALDGSLEVANATFASDDDHAQTSLLVNHPGPVAALDLQSIAVACGNVVNVIKASRRGAMIRRTSTSPLERQSSTSRKRMASRKIQ